jgi:hypothetical protein
VFPKAIITVENRIKSSSKRNFRTQADHAFEIERNPSLVLDS